MSFMNMEQQRLVGRIAPILIHNSETVSVAESSAGGLVAASLLSYPGASAYFVGGSVLYSYTIRESIVNMGPKEHSAYPGSTPELMMAIAGQFQKRTSTTWVLSEGGAAGPAKSHNNHPPGYTALAVKGPLNSYGKVETGNIDRLINMMAFTTQLLDLFLHTLQKHHTHKNDNEHEDNYPG